MGIILACQISSCSLLANVSVIGKAGKAACPSRRGHSVLLPTFRGLKLPGELSSKTTACINSYYGSVDLLNLRLGLSHLCFCGHIKTTHL